MGSGWSSEWMCMIDINMTVPRTPMPQTNFIFRKCLLLFATVYAKRALSWTSGECTSLHLLPHHRNPDITDVCFYVLIKKIMNVQNHVLTWCGRCVTHWAIFLAWLTVVSWLKVFKITFINLVFVCMCECMCHSEHMEARGQVMVVVLLLYVAWFPYYI